MTILPIFKPKARINDRSPLAVGRASRISKSLARLALSRDEDLLRAPLGTGESAVGLSSATVESESSLSLFLLAVTAVDDEPECPLLLRLAGFAGGGSS